MGGTSHQQSGPITSPFFSSSLGGSSFPVICISIRFHPQKHSIIFRDSCSPLHAKMGGVEADRPGFGSTTKYVDNLIVEIIVHPKSVFSSGNSRNRYVALCGLGPAATAVQDRRPSLFFLGGASASSCWLFANFLCAPSAPVSSFVSSPSTPGTHLPTHRPFTPLQSIACVSPCIYSSSLRIVGRGGWGVAR